MDTAFTHLLAMALGVDFISLQEGTDTTTPQGKLVFAIMAGLAELAACLQRVGEINKTRLADYLRVTQLYDAV